MSDELLGLGGSTDPFANGAKGRNKCVALFAGVPAHFHACDGDTVASVTRPPLPLL